ncbi:tail fiber domain-containing protein [uncultured Dokdonia sp.]|uniref:tail fiber domain-containing protein n=1 Tax=uncultured Dokdonia sp. TaxID=575653 RepID=UPI0026375167|nr:tail fiber domain-containing protein [uncultured Dokdonia sp.]
MKIIIFILVILIVPYEFYGQVGINTYEPDPSAALDILSTEKGIIVPKITQAQRNSITNPAAGLLIFQTDGTSGFYYYDATSWVNFGGQGWTLGGQAGSNSTINFIGTTDNQGFSIGTNNTEILRASPAGNLGIGELNPTAKLHLSGNAPFLRYQDGNESNNAFLASDTFGNTSWTQFISPSGNDDDWRFESGSTTADPIYHQNGGVVIGRTGTTIRNLDIDNGNLEGTTFGIGDIEFIRDGNNETQFSHSPVPRLQLPGNTPIDLGQSNLLWNTIYAINGTIQTSDQTLKKNIKKLNYGTKELMNLNPISFLWKEEKRNNLIIPKSERELKLGFIAQEVKELIPEVVSSTSRVLKDGIENGEYEVVESNYLGINYDELIPLLIKVKQEQHQRILILLEENRKLIEKLKNN